MGKNSGQSLYSKQSIVLTTKHSKSIVIAPAFNKELKAEVIECKLDTDILGTFSGEMERRGSQVECARQKCEMGMNYTGAEYGIASEGSFGPHPFMPLIPADQEILYFIDRKNDLALHLVEISLETNYQHDVVSSFEMLQDFAHKALYPSHGLIIKPHNPKDAFICFKGINTEDALREAFYESVELSADRSVWIETDMRAHMNPSRMKVIATLARKLAERLKACCPKCQAPGWGKVDIVKGLPCVWCNEETEFLKAEILGCTKCEYRDIMPRQDGLISVEPQHCHYCNP